MSEIIPFSLDDNSLSLRTSQLSPAAQWLAGLDDLSTARPDVAINRPLSELVEMTLTEAGNDSADTRRTYQTAIGLFLSWLSEELGDRLPLEWQPLAVAYQVQQVDRRNRHYTKTEWEYRGPAGVLRTVTAGSLGHFVASRTAEGNGKKTQQLYRQAVVTFLRVALRENVLTQEQATNLGSLKPYVKRQRRDEQPVGRRLSRDEVSSLRAAIANQIKNGTTAKATRDRAIFDCMLYGALRMAEVAGLQVDNFRQDGGRWWMVVTGKGDKTRRVKVHDTLYKSLEAWAKLAGVVLGEGSGALFVNFRRGGHLNTDKSTGEPFPLTQSIIGELVAEYGAAAGLAPRDGENRLSPHDLRRTCARNAYDNGATIYQVQTMLGHSDPKTTIRYIGALEDDDNTAVDHVNYGRQEAA